MSEQRFEVFQECEYLEEWSSCPYCIKYDGETVFETLPLGIAKEVCKKLNEQQELIEELQVSDEMGWKRAEMFEKKCPKELHNKKMYIKRLEYKVQKFKEENEQLRQELNGKDCRKCSNYCRDKALDYCLVDEREPYYFSFPFKWDYKAEAEKCKYYHR